MSSSVIIPLLRRTEINASFLAAGAEQTITLPTINLVPFHYATLIVRVHEATWSTGAYFRVEGYGSYPTREDAREFVDTSAGIAATVLQTATLPAVGTGRASNLPVACKFIAKLHMSSSATSWFAVVSVDLLLRAKNRHSAAAAQTCGGSPARSSSEPTFPHGGAADVSVPPQKNNCKADCKGGTTAACHAGPGEYCGAQDGFGCWVKSEGVTVFTNPCIAPPPKPGSAEPAAGQSTQLGIATPPQKAECESPCGTCKGFTCVSGDIGCESWDKNGKILDMILCVTPPESERRP